jgi:uncharacterized protein (DUF885 family)
MIIPSLSWSQKKTIMNSIKLTVVLLCALLTACSPSKVKDNTGTDENNKIQELIGNYYEERLKLYPIEATSNGDNRYNDQLYVDISEDYRNKTLMFFQSQNELLSVIDYQKLSEENKVNYDILKWELETSIESYNYPDHLKPINQFWSFTLSFPMMGSGQGNQPFKTVKDYDNFLSRISKFPAWADQSIVNMQEGVKKQITVPQILMKRVLPQMESMITKVEDNTFYLPIKTMPAVFSDSDKKRLDSLYTQAIEQSVIPTYKKLFEFIKNEYLPVCRTTIGISDVPGGKEHYAYLIKYWTTTDLTADSIFNLGMSEVTRLRQEMEKIKDETGYKGDLKSFFKFMNTDAQFFPFKTAAEVIDSFYSIQAAMQPQLNKLFDKVPRSKFEVRQTEKFREASASAEYNQGTADGSRPGIFYTPIPNPKKYNTFGMEDLFLHEAIPGHHYQNMLTIENDSLPIFRRYIWYGAYGEGWALYTESLGKELGLYKNPYQYFGSLSEEMHRAIRLVVDVGMHMKGWTKEQAINFSLENEGQDEIAVTSEIERYLAIPGQALSYKIGQLKIKELRAKAEKELGTSFDIKKFHNEVLNEGCLPLKVLEEKVDRWIAKNKNA